jgi:hypothetical protein
MTHRTIGNISSLLVISLTALVRLMIGQRHLHEQAAYKGEWG